MKGIDKKIVILAPSNEVELISKKAVKSLGTPIKIYNAKDIDLNKVVENLKRKAKECQNEGAEIAIVTVGADKLIRKHVDINMVTIAATGSDILKYLYKYREYKEPIAVVDGKKYIEGILNIGETLNLNMKPYEVSDYRNTFDKIMKAIGDGTKVIISGSGALHDSEIAYIERKGVTYEQIDPSERSVIEAIEEAKAMYGALRNEIRKKEMLKTILDFSTEGIVATDSAGVITMFNSRSANVIDKKNEFAVGSHICDIFPDIDMEQLIVDDKRKSTKILEINGTKIILNIVSIMIKNDVFGFIFNFEKIQTYQNIEKKIRVELSNKGLTSKYYFKDIIANSKEMDDLKKQAKKYSKTQSTILIYGETGTGKEVLAQAIHSESLRKNEPFVAINCSALPGNLLESELFGYAEGAFTGARKGGKQGVFELAHKGTIFLDEISDIDKTLQVRLLRVIQEREIMKIGDDRIIPVDVRIIAATNRDLYRAVKEDRFREDLFFRLNVLDIQVPSLRERKDDIGVLVEYFIKKFNKELKFKVSGFDDEIIEELKKHSWPGNIRELENTIEKIMVNVQFGFVRKNDIKEILERLLNSYGTASDTVINEAKTLEEIEKDIIMKVLGEENFNKSKTAKRLGIDRSTLFRKLNSY